MKIRRLLIVSPYFPPVNTPDMHRVRILLPFFSLNGWNVEVLAVKSEQVVAPLDLWLEEGLPRDLKVHRVKALGLGWSRIPGLGSLGFRALRQLCKAGDDLLANNSFDLVYFSTTVVEVHLLGLRWKRKYGVPFVLDYQDPWVNDYYREHREIVPPGGRIKYGFADALHRRMEPAVLRECSGITSVSPDYPYQLEKRYPLLSPLRSLVQSFPGAKRDFERLSEATTSQHYFNPRDGNIHWVYVGVVAPSMFTVLRAFFKALSTAIPPHIRSKIKLHFIGTNYAPAGRSTPIVLPLADEYGLAEQVQELCTRIPYSDSLKCLVDSNALIAIGSNDPGYNASKIHPYLLAKKPLLAVYHEKSPVVPLLRRVGGSVLVTFQGKIDESVLASDIANSWILNSAFSVTRRLDETAFECHTDHACAATICTFFEECLNYG